MKKAYFLILLLSLSAVSCSDKCTHGVDSDNISQKSFFDYLEGSWYEETLNEEVRYSRSGTFYDKYSNLLSYNETSGRYSVDTVSMRLSYYYDYLGQPQVASFQISELKDNSFVLSNESSGEMRVERILETHVMNVGESITLDYFEENDGSELISMETKSRIVSIDSENGVIKAEGEKGTAYIKLNTKSDTFWAKVVVGDECIDLWCDFISLIGKDYSGMVKLLGTPAINGDDGYSFGYKFQYHNLVRELDIYIDSSTSLIWQIGMSLSSGAPAAAIQSYLNAHYYPNSELSDKGYYTSGPSLAESIAVVQYLADENIVWLRDASYSAFPDYSEGLVKSQEEIIAKYGQPVIENNLYCYPIANLLCDIVFFSFSETTGKVGDVFLFLKPEIKPSIIQTILSERYNLYKSSDSIYYYMNGDQNNSTVLVGFDTEEMFVIWHYNQGDLR